jgi:hypothetical protein
MMSGRLLSNAHYICDQVASRNGNARLPVMPVHLPEVSGNDLGEREDDGDG